MSDVLLNYNTFNRFEFLLFYSKWNVSSGKKFDYFMQFINKVANITYENMEDIAPYVNNTELINIDITDLILKVLLLNKCMSILLYLVFSVHYI